MRMTRSNGPANGGRGLRHWLGGLCMTLAVLLLPAGARAQNLQLALVPADDELASFLRKADDLIAQKDYKNAIAILSAIIQRTDTTFYRVGKTPQFLPIRNAANDVLGRMPAEGLDQYRQLYDPQAYQLLLQAESVGDLSQLREVTTRFRHSSHGLRAMETLAELSFDRGLYAQAAWNWQRVLEATADQDKHPLLLAKIAASAHLAGEERSSAAAAEKLRSQFASATASLGGRETKLVEFVERVRKLPVAASMMVSRRGDWPSLWSMPGHVGIMDDADVVLAPRWRSTQDSLSGDDIRDKLIAVKNDITQVQSGRNMKNTVRLKDGVPQLRTVAGNQVREFALPAVVHPVVVGEWIVYRTDSAVVARDAFTGEIIWETFQLPLTREFKQNNVRNHYGYYGRKLLDLGRYALSVGDGKVYTLGRFRKNLGPYNRFGMQNNNQKDFEDTSALCAISLEAEGALVWWVGRDHEGSNPQGSDDLLKGCKYLSVPTFADGRLYSIAEYMESYWLICLESATGELVWKTRIAQTPPMPRNHPYSDTSVMEIGTPPSIADGRVYALTNAGVIACYDARSGQPVWAHQYDSQLNTGNTRYRGYSQLMTASFGMNPIVVQRGRVTVLPADSDKVLCVSADDGRSLWQVSRRGMTDLTGIDEQRLVISGSLENNRQSLAVLSAADGRVLAEPREAVDVYGRPAVTPTAVMACGPNKLYRLDLKSYAMTSIGPADPESLLGNLVSVGGRIYAANPVGINAYFSYEVAREKLGERLEGASEREKREIYFQRGQLAFSARRYDQALEDLLESKRLAEAQNNKSALDDLRTMLHRNYVALGNVASDAAGMKTMFDTAMGMAGSESEKAHMLLRLAKWAERAGIEQKDPQLFIQAVDTATQLIANYPETKMVDVAIGEKADPAVRVTQEEATTPGRVLAERFIDHMIHTHGRECYASFDVKAGEALDAARQAGDPKAMVAVARTYKHSKFRDEALFAAAEHHYLQALDAQGEAVQEQLNQSVKYFSEVQADDRSPLKVSATVALATIYARGNKPVAARLMLEQVRDEPPETPIGFAGVKGTLAEMIQQIENGEVPKSSVSLELERSVRTPLEIAYRLDGKDVFLVRDSFFQPVRVGQSVLALHQRRALLLDTSAKDFDSAVVWAGLTSIDSNALQQTRHMPPDLSLLGGISDDGQILAIADRMSCTGFDAGSGKRKWHIDYTENGIGRNNIQGMAIGQDVFTVIDGSQKIQCFNLSDGELRWRAQMPGRQRTAGQPMIAQHGLLLVPRQARQGLVAFDLKTGKLKADWNGGNAHGLFSPGGILLTMVGGTLSAWDSTNLSKPLWERKFDQNQIPSILGISDKQVIITPSMRAGQVELINLSGDGSSVEKFQTSRISGAAGQPFDAGFDRDGIYILCSRMVHGQPGAQYGRVTAAQGLNVQRFDLTKKKIVWNQQLLDESYNYVATQPMTIGREHVALAANLQNQAAAAWVIRGSDGDVARKIDLGSIVGGDGMVQLRIRGLSVPGMTSGQLVVEDIKGVAIYSGQ